jgi:hypothetical protein
MGYMSSTVVGVYRERLVREGAQVGIAEVHVDPVVHLLCGRSEQQRYEEGGQEDEAKLCTGSHGGLLS